MKYENFVTGQGKEGVILFVLSLFIAGTAAWLVFDSEFSPFAFAVFCIVFFLTYQENFMEVLSLFVGVVLGLAAGFLLGTWYCKNVKGMK